jgi:hypothetical protein
MSDDESFLARWSRRKRGAAAKTRGEPDPGKTVSDPTRETPAASLPPDEAQPLFDPASLPPIESIGAGSDIRAFLAPGVPADVTRAALRRAWSSDPAIRDFIGLSENSWDFNASGGVPGFGSVKAEDVRRLLAQAMGEPEAAAVAADTAPPTGEATSAKETAEPTRKSSRAAEPARQQPGVDNPSQDQQQQDNDTRANHCDRVAREEVNAAMQRRSDVREYSLLLPRGPHGGALPE